LDSCSKMNLLSLIFLLALPFGLSNEELKLRCPELENTDFVEKCVSMYCECIFPCIEEYYEFYYEPNFECFLKNGCSEEDILFMNTCFDCIEEPPEETRLCDGKAAPSVAPTISHSPTISHLPTTSPTRSQSPTLSSAPTVDCICPNCNHTSGCNPDPHYTAWDNSFYDFQGGCDQIAIDNNILQVQIRTRPRNYYSTITEAAIVFKLSGEVFRIGVDSGISNGLSSASEGTYVEDSPTTHTINFIDGVSFIRFNLWSRDLSIQVFGNGATFCGSEGMFGSWNSGGVRFPDGTAFDLSGGWAGTRERSIALAEAWMVPLGQNVLTNPSDVCDASSSCGGPGDAFACDDTRRLRHLQTTCLTSDCDHIENDVLRGACEEDLALSNGDTSWTCQPSYVNPVIVEADLCDFKLPSEGSCYSIDDICSRMGGYCKPDCTNTNSHVCLPGLCADSSPPGILETKSPKSSKSSKAVSQSPTMSPMKQNSCMCYVPSTC